MFLDASPDIIILIWRALGRKLTKYREFFFLANNLFYSQSHRQMQEIQIVYYGWVVLISRFDFHEDEQQ